MAEGADQLDAAVTWLIENAAGDPSVPGSASFNLLMLAGTVLGGWQMARAAQAVINDPGPVASDTAFCDAKLATVRFYAEHIMPRAGAYAQAATAGTDALQSLSIDAL